jgi:TonB family protein
MTPSLEHAERMAPRRQIMRWPWRQMLRWPRSTLPHWPRRLSFGPVLAASAMLHLALFAVLAAWPAQEPRQNVTVYTVRVVDAPAGKASPAVRAAKKPASQAPLAERGADVVSMAAPAVVAQAESPPAVAIAHAAAGQSNAQLSPAETLPATAATPSAAFADAGAGAAIDLPAVDAEALDPGFSLLTPVEMAYPDAARRARKAGRVRLEVEIGPDGRVLAVHVVEATPGWGFAVAARSAYEGARFSPPRRHGRPVRVLWRKTLLFQP